jgi:hypothetical protein
MWPASSNKAHLLLGFLGFFLLHTRFLHLALSLLHLLPLLGLIGFPAAPKPAKKVTRSNPDIGCSQPSELMASMLEHARQTRTLNQEDTSCSHRCTQLQDKPSSSPTHALLVRPWTWLDAWSMPGRTFAALPQHPFSSAPPLCASGPPPAAAAPPPPEPEVTHSSFIASTVMCHRS